MIVPIETPVQWKLPSYNPRRVRAFVGLGSGEFKVLGVIQIYWITCQIQGKVTILHASRNHPCPFMAVSSRVGRRTSTDAARLDSSVVRRDDGPTNSAYNKILCHQLQCSSTFLSFSSVTTLRRCRLDPLKEFLPLRLDGDK
ncbi:hypothetical protein Hamer_G018209 [Homarus americanus]|uniref:Uncharacterized protein n=1 Tax=Homarus americanus TaxID=6706 RepID=A0A8J5JCZ4_HOMAM|nr:hypothetical protein Hamer_G018209 [Homarus americanus]